MLPTTCLQRGAASWKRSPGCKGLSSSPKSTPSKPLPQRPTVLIPSHGLLVITEVLIGAAAFCEVSSNLTAQPKPKTAQLRQIVLSQKTTASSPSILRYMSWRLREQHRKLPDHPRLPHHHYLVSFSFWYIKVICTSSRKKITLKQKGEKAKNCCYCLNKS